MAKITYIDDAGTKRTMDVPDDWSVMQGAVMNDVPGIDADCGGSCACGTCHVYVDAAWIKRLPPMLEAERDMLRLSSRVQENSRLSCQLKVSAALDGLVVKTPESQR